MGFKSSTLVKAALVVGLVVALVLGYQKWSQPVAWPQFPAAPGPAPAVVVDVRPDFGYRIGDPVRVTVFIKEFPGTTIDTGGLALEGDFEIRGQMDVQEGRSADGARLVAVKMELQSFRALESLSASMSLPWQVDGSKEVQDLRAPLVKVYTSNTWDGRKDIQDGPLPIIWGSRVVLAGALLLVGLAGLLASIWYIRWVKASMPAPDSPLRVPSPRKQTWLHFNRIWQKIQAGDLSEENFREIARITRKFLDVETVLLEHVPVVLGNAHPHVKQIMYVLELCERVVYTGQKPSAEELAELKKSFDDFILMRY